MVQQVESAAAKGSESREYLAVRIGEQEFAIDIMAVREIRGWISSTPMPHSPPSVRGMINLRGIVVPILDLAECLGLDPIQTASSSVVVVVRIDTRTIGLLVDAVCGIVAIDAANVQPTPDVGSYEDRPTIRGLVMIDGRIVGIVEVPNIIPEKSMEAA